MERKITEHNIELIGLKKLEVFFKNEEEQFLKTFDKTKVTFNNKVNFQVKSEKEIFGVLIEIIYSYPILDSIEEIFRLKTLTEFSITNFNQIFEQEASNQKITTSADMMNFLVEVSTSCTRGIAHQYCEKTYLENVIFPLGEFIQKENANKVASPPAHSKVKTTIKKKSKV